MEIRRFFADIENFNGKNITIFGDEFLHLKNVLRMKVGYKLIVCLNDGKEYHSTIEKIEKDFAVVKVDNIVEVEQKICFVTLFPALLKNNKLDYVIQKGVELGVDEIVPYTSKFSNETKFNLERANRIALEATKQCGRTTLTTVKEPTTFDDVVEKFASFDKVLFPYEDADEVAFKNAKFDGEKFAIVIGSEGGFHEDEVKMAKENNAQIVTLGKRILRADTASIVSLTLLMNEIGELG